MSLSFVYSGVWGIGMATRQCNLHQVPLGNDKEAWVLRNDGTLWHNNTEKGHLPEVPQEGDVLVSLSLYAVIVVIKRGSYTLRIRINNYSECFVKHVFDKKLLLQP